MKLAAVLVLALALPACAAVSAEEGSSTSKSGGDDWYAGSPTGKKEYGRQGGYAAIAGLKGLEQFDLGAGAASPSSGNSDLGFAIRGGWRTKEGLAVEGSIESVTGYSVDVLGKPVDLDFSSLSMAGKYYLANERIQPYAMVGFGYAWVDTKFTGFDANAPFIRFGAGADFYVNKDIAIFGEVNYNRMTGDLKDLDHLDIVVGVLFRF